MIAETEVYLQRAAGEPLERAARPLDPGPDEVVVEVAACGLCHTDLGFLDGSVEPRGGRPLVPGHEVSGTVVAARGEAERLIGRQVVVPAMWPCGRCDLCVLGRPTSCPGQRMPGNDVPGGFARHLVAPARWLAPLPAAVAPDRLEEMAVVADAVATPLEAVRRSRLGVDDLAIVVGVGGLGGFLVQIAASRDAAVLALDIDEDRLARSLGHGARAAVSVRGKSPREVRGEVRAAAAALGVQPWGWKIFETSGTAEGQRTAFELVGPAATIVVVGYTRDRVEIRLSNLMAFDAAAIGVWGCRPQHYPEAIDLVLSGQVVLAPFVERHPMALVNEVVARAHAGKLAARAVLVAGDRPRGDTR